MSKLKRISIIKGYLMTEKKVIKIEIIEIGDTNSIEFYYPIFIDANFFIYIYDFEDDNNFLEILTIYQNLKNVKSLKNFFLEKKHKDNSEKTDYNEIFEKEKNFYKEVFFKNKNNLNTTIKFILKNILNSVPFPPNSDFFMEHNIGIGKKFYSCKDYQISLCKINEFD